MITIRFLGVPSVYALWLHNKKISIWNQVIKVCQEEFLSESQKAVFYQPLL